MSLFLFRADILKSSSREFLNKTCNDPLTINLMLSDWEQRSQSSNNDPETRIIICWAHLIHSAMSKSYCPNFQLFTWVWTLHRGTSGKVLKSQYCRLERDPHPASAFALEEWWWGDGRHTECLREGKEPSQGRLLCLFFTHKHTHDTDVYMRSPAPCTHSKHLTSSFLPSGSPPLGSQCLQSRSELWWAPRAPRWRRLRSAAVVGLRWRWTAPLYSACQCTLEKQAQRAAASACSGGRLRASSHCAGKEGDRRNPPHTGIRLAVRAGRASWSN